MGAVVTHAERPQKPAIASKADRDRLRQRAGGARARLDTVLRIVREYEQGRAAAACMDDIKAACRGAPRRER